MCKKGLNANKNKADYGRYGTGGGKGQAYLNKDLKMELLMTTAGGYRL